MVQLKGSQKLNQTQKLAEAFELYRVKELHRADQLCRTILSDFPHNADALHLLGCISEELGQGQIAVQYVQKALRLSPSAYPYHYNLANMLMRQGDPVQAILHYKKATQLKPDYLNAHHNLGLAQKTVHDIDGAIMSYRTVIALRPDHALAHLHLGNALSQSQRPWEAVAAFQASVRLNPGNAEAWTNLGVVQMRIGKVQDAVQSFQKALAIDPNDVHSHSNLILAAAYSSADPGDMLRLCELWWQSHAQLPPTSKPFPIARAIAKPKQLRVGYVSADFRQHAAAYWIEPLLAGHNHTLFHVTCYSNSAQVDEVTERLRLEADQWVPCGDLSDKSLIERIQHDEIDILVDLSGHTSGNRLKVFAAHAAPVQVSWFGFPVSTGLKTVQYRFTDGQQDPPGNDVYYCEELIRLPDFYAAFKPDPRTPPVKMLPMLHSGHVTFVSMNNLAKITPEMLVIWAEILRKTPDSRLIMQAEGLGSQEVVATIAAVFSNNGISRDRLHFRDWTQLQDFLDLGNQADIALDPFPFNGGVTSCHALWMGLPIITLSGQAAASRVGMSLLTSLGLSELVASRATEYIDLACQLASNPARLQSLRETMRTRMSGSPLLDGAILVKSVERAYESIWKNWCQADEPTTAAHTLGRATEARI